MGRSCGSSMGCGLHTSLHSFTGLFILPCAGNAGVFRLYLYARVRFLCALLHTRPRVQRAPGIPCSLFLEGKEFEQSSDAICVARTRNCIQRDGLLRFARKDADSSGGQSDLSAVARRAKAEACHGFARNIEGWWARSRRSFAHPKKADPAYFPFIPSAAGNTTRSSVRQ